MEALAKCTKVYKRWRLLPAEQRERYKDHAARMNTLVRELLGIRGAAFLEGEDEMPPAHDGTGSGRAQAEILADLRDATSALRLRLLPQHGPRQKELRHEAFGSRAE